MPERRQLRFDTLADAVRDAELMLTYEYTRLGNWTLGQTCGHLANWLSYPLDGFPQPPLLVRPLLWMARVTVGRKRFEQYVRGERDFPAGAPTLPESVPAVSANAADEVARFKAAAERYEAHTGPIHPSPLFGPLTKDEARKIQLVHCAHHLSFLVPNT